MGPTRRSRSTANPWLIRVNQAKEHCEVELVLLEENAVTELVTLAHLATLPLYPIVREPIVKKEKQMFASSAIFYIASLSTL